MSWDRDRDLDGVPDWQEDENYADEAPIATHYQPWRAVFDYGPGTEGIPQPTPTPTP